MGKYRGKIYGAFSWPDAPASSPSSRSRGSTSQHTGMEVGTAWGGWKITHRVPKAMPLLLVRRASFLWVRTSTRTWNMFRYLFRGCNIVLFFRLDPRARPIGKSLSLLRLGYTHDRRLRFEAEQIWIAIYHGESKSCIMVKGQQANPWAKLIAGGRKYCDCDGFEQILHCTLTTPNVEVWNVVFWLDYCRSTM